tara:strand:+ start:54 stop:1157 length:1104 start_codon:yes stop_codon:yes gene_type:complete
MIKLKIWLYNWLAKDLGKLGREGDTELAHVNTWEANLLKAHGGSGTINPVTGLREYKGGGGGQTQTTTQNIDPAILPYITYGLDESKNLYQDASPEYYPDATYVPASSQTQSALNAAQARATAGSPLIPQAQSTISGMQSAVNPALSNYDALTGGIPSGALAGTETTAGGSYLSAGNPYFSSMMASAAKPAVTEFNKAIRDIGSRTAASGRYGSGAMGELEGTASENLANSLTQRAAELAYSNYGAERGRQEQAVARLGDITNQQFNQQLSAAQGLGNLTESQAQRQMNAAQLAPSLAAADYSDIQQLMNVGQQEEDYSRQALQSDIGRFEFEQNKPYSKLQSYLSAAYGAPAPMNSTTQSSGGGGK